MYDLALDVADKLNLSDPKSWLFVCGIALVIGYFCLKGLSRN